MTRVCTICGKEFESARNNLTCSNECFAELKSRRKKEQSEKYHEEKNKAHNFMSQNMKEIGLEYGLDCVMVKLNDELRKIGIVDKDGNWNFEEE